jgi:hypothetical protein
MWEECEESAFSAVKLSTVVADKRLWSTNEDTDGPCVRNVEVKLEYVLRERAGDYSVHIRMSTSAFLNFY